MNTIAAQITLATQTTIATRTPWIVGLFAGCLISATSIPTARAAGEEAPRLVVTYDPHSLATDSGVRALYRRLESAARQVCPDDSLRDPARVAVTQRCRESSLARAVRDINDPRLAVVVAEGSTRG